MRGFRKAFTLFEVILVMGLLVVTAALAIPVARSMYASARVTAAADTVRSHWSQARSRAIEERRAYRFSVKDGTGCFRVAPDSDEFWGDGQGEMGGPGQPLVLEGTLPETITFCQADANRVPDGGEGGSWRTVAVFQPDGTAREDVIIAFGTAGQTPTLLRLRAATGDITSASLPNARRDG